MSISFGWLRYGPYATGSNPVFSEGTHSSSKEVMAKVSLSNWLKTPNRAIDFVYRTFLPGRTYHVYAPVTSGGSSWPLDALQQVAASFDSVDIHDYSSDISSYVRTGTGGWTPPATRANRSG